MDTIDQSNWDEIIYTNEYDTSKEIVKYEFNDFGINGLFTTVEEEYSLDYYTNTQYSTYISELNLDIIDSISLKIKLSNPIDKLLLFGFYIRIHTRAKSDHINILNTNLLDCTLLSYLNNHSIEDDENIITIPLIQFNTLEHGYLYTKTRRKGINVDFDNALSAYFLDSKYDDIITSVKIVFNGRKYYDFNELMKVSKEKYYKPIDINWFYAPYNPDGVTINGIDTRYQFIVFKLIPDKDYIEFIDNQPIVEKVFFDSYEYDIKYMKQIILFGVNIYILPLYPEFTNLDNILYYLKNSKNGTELYLNEYKIKIKTNIVNEKYDLYLSFFGEWIS
jgi:hypothetical protein